MSITVTSEGAGGRFQIEVDGVRTAGTTGSGGKRWTALQELCDLTGHHPDIVSAVLDEVLDESVEAVEFTDRAAWS